MAVSSITIKPFASHVVVREDPIFRYQITVGAIQDNSVTTATLRDNAVTTAKIAANAVTGTQIANNAVTQAKMADGSVGSNQIADDAVTEAKIAPDSVGSQAIQTGAVDTDALAPLSVTEGKVAANAVSTDAIKADAVTTAKIAANAVTAAELADDAVGSDQIADDAVTSDHIANDAVGNDQLAANAVQRSNISAGAVGNAELGTNAVTDDKISANSVGGSELKDDAVSSSHIEDGAVGTGQISDNAVTGAKIAALAVTLAKIAANAVGTTQLVNGAVTQAKMANGAVGEAQLGNDAVTQAKMADNSVGAAQIQASAVGASELANDSVSNAKLTNNSVGTAEIINASVTHAKLGADAVEQDNIADGAVGTDQIAALAVTGAKVAANAITQSKLADDSVGTDQVANNAVTLTKVGQDVRDAITAAGQSGGGGGGGTPGPLSITTAMLANDAVTEAKIADGAVGTDQIAANAVTGAKIAANAITQLKMGDDSVGTAELIAASVTHDILATNSVRTTHIQDGAVTHDKIGADAVDESNLADDAVGTNQLADNVVTTDKVAANAVTMPKLGQDVRDAITAAGMTGSGGGGGGGGAQTVETLVASNIAVSIGAQNSPIWVDTGLTIRALNQAGDSTGTLYFVAALAINIGSGNELDRQPKSIVASVLVEDWLAMAETTAGSSVFTTDSISTFGLSANNDGSSTPTSLLAIARGANGQLLVATYDVNDTRFLNYLKVSLQKGGGGSATPADNSITTAMLQALSVTEPKLASASVSARTIVAGAVGTDKLASDAVTGPKIADNAVSSAHIVAGAIGTTQLANGSVTLAKIASGVIPTELPPTDDSVSTGKVQDNAVTLAKVGQDVRSAITAAGQTGGGASLTDNSIQTSYLQDGSVTRPKIAADAIDGTRLADAAVSSEHIAANAVTTDRIQAGSITAILMAPNAIAAGNIIDGNVTEAKLGAGSVTAGKIAAGSVLEAALGALSVSAGKIQDAAVTTRAIAAAAIGPNQISTIGLSNIPDGLITGAKVAARTIEGGDIALGTLTANLFAEGVLPEAETPATGSPWTTLLEIRPDTNIGDGVGALAAVANSTFSPLLTADHDDGWIVFKAAVSGVNADPTHSDETPHVFGAFRASEWRLLPESAAGDLSEDSRVLYATGHLATGESRNAFVVSFAKGPNNTLLANFDLDDVYLTYLKVELYDPTFLLAGGGGAASATTNTVLVDVDSSTEGVPWDFGLAANDNSFRVLPDTFDLSRELTEADGTSGGMLFVELGLSADVEETAQTGAIATFAIPVADFLALPVVAEGAGYNVTKGFGLQLAVHAENEGNQVRRPCLGRAANNKIALGLKGGGDDTFVTSLKVRLIVPGGGASAPAANSIQTDMVRNGAITDDKIADGTISKRKLVQAVQDALGGTPVYRTRSDIVLANQVLRHLLYIEDEKRRVYADEFQHIADHPIEVTYSQSASLASGLSPFSAFGASLHVINPLIDFTAGSIALASGVTGATLPTTFGGIAQLDTTDAGEWVVWLHTSETFVPTVLDLVNKHGTEYTLHLSRWKTIGDYNVYLSSNVYVASQHNLLGTEEGATGNAMFRFNLKDADGHSIVAGATDLVRRLVDVPRASSNSVGDKANLPKAEDGDTRTDAKTGDRHEATTKAASRVAMLNLNHVSGDLYGLDVSTPESVGRDMGTVSSLLYDDHQRELMVTDTGTSPISTLAVVRHDERRRDVTTGETQTFAAVPKPAEGHPSEEHRLHAGLRKIDTSHHHVTLTDAQRAAAFPSGWNTLTSAHAPANIGQMQWDATARRIKWNLGAMDHPDTDDSITGLRYTLSWHGTLSNGYFRFAVDQNHRLGSNAIVDGATQFPEGGIWEIRVQMAGSGDSYLHGAFLHNTQHTGRRWALIVHRVTEDDGDAQTKEMQYNAVRHPLAQADGAVVPQEQADHYNFPNVQEMRNLLTTGEDNEVYIAVVELESSNANSNITRHWLPSPHAELFARGVWGIKAEIERIDLSGSRGATEGTYAQMYYQTERYSPEQVARYGNPFAIGRNDLNARTAHGATQSLMAYKEQILDTDIPVEVSGTRADGSAMLAEAAQTYWELASRGGKWEIYTDIADIPAPKHEGQVIQASFANANVSPRMPRFLTSARGYLHDEGILLRNTGTPSGATDSAEWEVLADRIHGITITQARWQGGALILDYLGRTDLTASNTRIQVVAPNVGLDDTSTTLSFGQSSVTGQRFVRITDIDGNVQYAPIVVLDMRSTDHGVTDDLPVTAEEAHYFL